jgi:hypothetical protein
MTQTNYHFSPITFELLYENQAQLDLLETEKQGIDVYLVPGSATAIAAPVAGANQVPVFDKNLNSWSVQSDYRGTWYDPTNGNPEYIEDIGVSPTLGFVDTPPPAGGYEWDGAQWVRTLELAKQQKRQEIVDAYNLSLVPTVASVGYSWVISEDAIRLAISLYWMRKTFLSGDYDFPDASLNIVTLNDVDAKTMLEARANAFKPILGNFIEKSKLINDAVDVATVDAITW